MTAIAEADFVIEAVIENLETKSKVFEAAGCNYPARCDTGFEYVFDIDHEDCLEDQAAR